MRLACVCLNECVCVTCFLLHLRVYNRFTVAHTNGIQAPARNVRISEFMVMMNGKTIICKKKKKRRNFSVSRMQTKFNENRTYFWHKIRINESSSCCHKIEMNHSEWFCIDGTQSTQTTESFKELSLFIDRYYVLSVNLN